MTKRMTVMLLAVVAFLAILGGYKYLQIRKAMAGGRYQPPPEAVTTVVAHQETWPESLAAVGSVNAVHGVTIGADLPGLVTRIAFESGRPVRAGDVLVQLDSRQEQAQLAAAEAQDHLNRLNLERARQLRDQGIIAQADLDQAAATAQQGEAAIGEIRATIERKTIRAPFAGVAGIRRIDLGQYVAGGDPIVPLQALDPVYVDFALPQQQVGQLHRGAEVQVSAAHVAGTPSGHVTAVDSKVDEATRNVHVQATLSNHDGALSPGMFVDVRVMTGTGERVIAVPATAINHAPYGDSVYVVTGMKGPDGKPYRGARQQLVKVGGSRGDQVAVVSGLQGGDEVVTSGVFKLRNGAAVVVNNEVQPANNPAPTPEDS